MLRLQLNVFSLIGSLCLAVPTPVNGEELNGLDLTLDQLVQYVVLHNPLVREARLEYLISRSEAEENKGTFEPELVARYDRSELERENNTLQALQLLSDDFWEKNDEYGLGIEGTFFSGGTYRIGYSLNRMNNSKTDGREYETFLGISAEQPSRCHGSDIFNRIGKVESG